jgi:Ca-activated chloride channel family protein
MGWRGRLRYLPLVLRLLALVLVMIAFAGPRRPLEQAPVTTEGVNIVLVIDTSTSMAARDFKVEGKAWDRLSVVKKVVKEFVGKRPSDRLALIAFAARPYTVCPLTLDHPWLTTQLERIDFGLMEDGTAIGSAIASGVNRLRKAEGKSKVMVLLTDGINNSGSIDPVTAAQAAKANQIRIYTIGAGSRDPGTMPGILGNMMLSAGLVAIDEDVLRRIADTTGGKYFRATDTASLEEIYRQIDAMEKTRIEDKGYREYEELFSYLVGAALILLCFELALGRTFLLKIP